MICIPRTVLLQGPVRALAVDLSGQHLVTAGADGQVGSIRHDTGPGHCSHLKCCLTNRCIYA